MTTRDLPERSLAIGYVGAFLTVVALFVLPRIVSIQPDVFIALAVLGLLLTVLRGNGLLRLIAGGLVAYSFLSWTFLVPRTRDAPDLQEPIPVPSGYAFVLDEDSTNRTHLYDSGPLEPRDARRARGEIFDYYSDQLRPEWFVVVANESTLTLRELDSTRGIGISVYVVTPQGRPARLDLRIQALYCPQEDRCMTAPISALERYPGGGEISPSARSDRTLVEPVQLPADLGFVASPDRWDDDLHVYVSTAPISLRGRHRAHAEVMRYYEQALTPEWLIVEIGPADLEVKDPSTTRGIHVRATVTGISGTAVITLEIQAVTCPEDYWCSTGL